MRRNAAQKRKKRPWPSPDFGAKSDGCGGRPWWGAAVCNLMVVRVWEDENELINDGGAGGALL